MSKPLSENARTILAYMKENFGANITAVQAAEDLGLGRKTVDAIVTALAKRSLAERTVVEGVEKKVIGLTKEGLAFDPDAVVETEA